MDRTLQYKFSGLFMNDRMVQKLIASGAYSLEVATVLKERINDFEWTRITYVVWSRFKVRKEVHTWATIDIYKIKVSLFHPKRTQVPSEPSHTLSKMLVLLSSLNSS